MAQFRAPDDWDPPSVVQVTVEAGPRAGGVEARVRRMRTAIALGMVGTGVAVCAVFVSGGLAGGGRGAERSAKAPAPVAIAPDGSQLVAVTEAYRFPLGCVSVTVSDGKVRAHPGPCWRYGVSVTAILRRIAGIWRLALEVRSPNCPRLALPASLLARLAVCRR